jgi:hypothetical protein
VTQQIHIEWLDGLPTETGGYLWEDPRDHELRPVVVWEEYDPQAAGGSGRLMMTVYRPGDGNKVQLWCESVGGRWARVVQ